MAALADALVHEVRRDLLETNGPVSPAAVASAVAARGRFLGPSGALTVVERISAELTGLGPLQMLAEVPGVTDIFVNVWWLP